MKLVAPVTAAVVTVLLAGLAGPAAGGGQPGPDHTPAASGPSAAARGAVTLASHEIGYRTEPRPAISASSGAHLSAAQTGGASPGTPADGTRAAVAAQARWKATRAPLPSGAATGSMTQISGLACPSARECVAVGQYNDSSGNFQGLLVTGHRSSWTAVTAPVPAGAATMPQTIISGVACPSARECVAVGQYNDSSGNYQGLLVTGHRSSWTAVTAPVPAGAVGNSGASIAAITCPSARACVAVGYWNDSSGNSHLFLLTRHGSSWTATTAPLPAGALANLGAGISVLDCPSATACTAVGSYTDSSGTSHLFLLTRHGSSWTATTAPLPAGAPANPYIFIGGIACPSSTACVATGWYGDANFPSEGNHGLLLTRHGSSWSATTAPLPAGITGRYTSITAVACRSATTCTAVGSYTDSAGNGQGVLLVKHRWSWTAATAPAPSGAPINPFSSITAVACPSATTCTAVGSYTDSAGNGQGLLLMKHRWSWTAATAPAPSDATTNPEAFITGIACPSATACTAIGSYTDSSGNSQGLLLTMHGS